MRLHDLASAKSDEGDLKGKVGPTSCPPFRPVRNYLWHTDRGGGGEPLFGVALPLLVVLAQARARSAILGRCRHSPGPATGPFHWGQSSADHARDGPACRPSLMTSTSPALSPRRSGKLGNAVPSLLAEALAAEIGSQLLGCTASAQADAGASESAQRAAENLRQTTVPAKFLDLKGEHEAHPGTGLGPRAQARVSDHEKFINRRAAIYSLTDVRKTRRQAEHPPSWARRLVGLSVQG